MEELKVVADILKALHFSATKHRDQRRKDVEASPYINHPIEVATVLATVALLTWRLGPYPAYDEEGKLLGEGARKRSVNVHADAA